MRISARVHVPARIHGVVVGLAVLVASPALTLVLSSGTAANTGADASAASKIVADRSGSFMRVDIPELSAPEPMAAPATTDTDTDTATATATATATPTATPTATATAVPAATATAVPATPKRQPAAPVANPTPTPRRVPPTSSAGPVAAPGTVEGIIIAAANAHGVSSAFMLKISACESGYRPNAYNPAGPYIGIFQFLPSTFRAHGGTNIYDPTQQANIAATMLAAGESRAWGCA